MDFDLNDEQKMIRDVVRDFALRELEPLAEEIDRESRHPVESVEKLGQLGIMGMLVPEEYGGSGSDTISYAIAIEEISRVCASTGIIVSVNNSLACYPILMFGNEEQKKKYLTPLASGSKLGGFSMTEPDHGSDVFVYNTTAVKDGDDYILNGRKIFCTNGSVADTMVVFAMTDKDAKHKGQSAFIIPTDTPGYTVGGLEDKLGIRGSKTAEYLLDDVRIPAENLLGSEGMGFRISMSTLDCGRIGVAAQALGIAQGSLDKAIEFARDRKQFGKPISKHQYISFQLADMETRIQAARHLVYAAAHSKDTKKRFSKEAAMAKLYAAETAMWVATKSLQIHGGYGYTKDYAIERYFRDAKITEIYEGTSEVQRMVIAGALGL